MVIPDPRLRREGSPFEVKIVGRKTSAEKGTGAAHLV